MLRIWLSVFGGQPSPRSNSGEICPASSRRPTGYGSARVTWLLPSLVTVPGDNEHEQPACKLIYPPSSFIYNFSSLIILHALFRKSFLPVSQSRSVLALAASWTAPYSIASCRSSLLSFNLAVLWDFLVRLRTSVNYQRLTLYSSWRITPRYPHKTQS